MNVSPLEVYMILQLDQIKSVLATLQLVSVLLAIFCGFAAYINWATDKANPKLSTDYRDRGRALKSRAKLTVIVCISLFIIISLTNALLPSTKNAAAILMVPAVVNSETTKRVGGKMLNVGELALDRLSELLSESKGEE